MEPPQYAVGRQRTLGGGGPRRRHTGGAAASSGRTNGVGFPTVVVATWRPAVCVGPDRLVEPVPLARRTGRGAASDGGRVWPAPVGLWAIHLRFYLTRRSCMCLCRGWYMAPGASRPANAGFRANPYPVHGARLD